MFRNVYQTGFISVLYSIGSDPLQIWDTKEMDGTVERVWDEDLRSSVIELKGVNIATTYVKAPKRSLGRLKSLGITLPYLVVLVKNIDEPFSMEVQVVDSKNQKRRFRASTFQKSIKQSGNFAVMPLKLAPGWNHIQFDLDDFLRRAYGTTYKETVEIQIHCTCRLRRVYFTDEKSYNDVPAEFKLMVQKDKSPLQ